MFNYYSALIFCVQLNWRKYIIQVDFIIHPFNNPGISNIYTTVGFPSLMCKQSHFASYDSGNYGINDL